MASLPAYDVSVVVITIRNPLDATEMSETSVFTGIRSRDQLLINKKSFAVSEPEYQRKFLKLKRIKKHL